MRLILHLVIAVVGVLIWPDTSATAAEEVNIYSARHYDSDDLLYDGFEAATGIGVNVIEGDGPVLLARMKAEGRNSPADVFLTVDAGNLWLAEREGVFQSVDSKTLRARVPESLRSPSDLWFGFSTRARVIFVNPSKVDPEKVQTYAALADAALRGKVCMRTSSAMYNLSLMGALIERLGPEGAEAWANGVVANFARSPQGVDTSLLLSVAAGECGVTIANHYYYVRLRESKVAAERAAAKALVAVFPDQQGAGTHVNISGAGVLAAAPHKEAAVRFLEYLTSEEAQRIFASANFEFPAVAGVAGTPELEIFGSYRIDPTNVSAYGKNQTQAQMIFDRAGWQ